jgi:hypothetical protein
MVFEVGTKWRKQINGNATIPNAKRIKDKTLSL